MNLVIYHNMLWAKYKGGVFSALNEIAVARAIPVSFVQIAETEGDRAILSGVDLSYHTYPYTLLFKGAYGATGRWQRVRALVGDLMKRNPSIVIIPGFDRLEYWALLLLCMLRGIQRAVFCDSTIHDRPRTGLKEVAKRFFFSRCQGVFCYGSRSKEYLMHYGVPANKIHFRVQAAALPHDYSPAAILAKYREQASAQPRRPGVRLVYVGRLSNEKGLPDLIEAFARFHRTSPQSELSIVGAGPLRDSLVAQAQATQAAPAIHFLGARDLSAITVLYRENDAMVLASHSEPWGLVVNEAMAYGCPVIVSDACGCFPELVVDGVTGFGFKTGNLDSLVQAFAKLAALPGTREEIAQKCIRHIADYNPRRAGEQILAGSAKILGEAAS